MTPRNITRFTEHLQECSAPLTPEQARGAADAALHGWDGQLTPEALKQQARQLAEFLSALGWEVKHTKCLEAIARLHGERNWHFARQHTESTLPAFKPGYKGRVPAGHPRFRHRFALIVPWWIRDELPAEANAMLEELGRYFNDLEAPAGWVLALVEGRMDEAARLAGPRARHLRQVQDLIREHGWGRAFGSAEKVSAHLADNPGGFLPIGGLDCGSVLAALYNAACPVGYGVYWYQVTPMTAQEGRELYERHHQGKPHAYVDYLDGRRLKLMFDERPWLDTSRYEEPYLPGLSAYALEVLRVTGDPAHDLIRQAHVSGLFALAASEDIFVDTPLDDPGLTSSGRRLVEVLQENIEEARKAQRA